MSITIDPKPKAVLEAIHLKCANCYGALAMANALGGMKTEAWVLCHEFSLKDLIAHAQEKGISLVGLRSAMDDIPVEESMYFKRATGAMTEAEFQQAFRKWKRGP